MQISHSYLLEDLMRVICLKLTTIYYYELFKLNQIKWKINQKVKNLMKEKEMKVSKAKKSRKMYRTYVILIQFYDLITVTCHTSNILFQWNRIEKKSSKKCCNNEFSLDCIPIYLKWFIHIQWMINSNEIILISRWMNGLLFFSRWLLKLSHNQCRLMHWFSRAIVQHISFLFLNH